ncbi:MAG: hypothetical protein AB7N65_09715 [Vicinamibacterales bacterium]
MNSRFVTPGLVGGVVIGVLSALPLISAGNLCCCLWVILGGVVAAYLLQQSEPGPISAADGALSGAIAGGAGALIYLLLSIPISLMVGPLERAFLQRLAEAGADLPPGFENGMSGAEGASLRLLLGFLFMLVASPLFAGLGGLIGAMAFRKPLPPSPPRSPSEPIDVPFSSEG